MRPEGDLCDTGPAVLHRLIPKSARAVSLHVYRPPLRTMGVWNDDGLKEIRGSRSRCAEEFERLAASKRSCQLSLENKDSVILSVSEGATCPKRGQILDPASLRSSG